MTFKTTYNPTYSSRQYNYVQPHVFIEAKLRTTPRIHRGKTTYNPTYSSRQNYVQPHVFIGRGKTTYNPTFLLCTEAKILSKSQSIIHLEAVTLIGQEMLTANLPEHLINSYIENIRTLSETIIFICPKQKQASF